MEKKFNISLDQLSEDDNVLKALKKEIDNKIDLFAVANIHNLFMKHGKELFFNIRYFNEEYKLFSIQHISGSSINFNQWGSENIGYHLAKIRDFPQQNFILYSHDKTWKNFMKNMFSQATWDNYQTIFATQIANNNIIDDNKTSNLYKSFEQAKEQYSDIHGLKDMKTILSHLENNLNSSLKAIHLKVNRGFHEADNRLNCMVFINSNGIQREVPINQPITFFTSNILSQFPKIKEGISDNGLHEVAELNLSLALTNFSDFYSKLLDTKINYFEMWYFQNNLEKSLPDKNSSLKGKKI